MMPSAGRGITQAFLTRLVFSRRQSPCNAIFMARRQLTDDQEKASAETTNALISEHLEDSLQALLELEHGLKRKDAQQRLYRTRFETATAMKLESLGNQSYVGPSSMIQAGMGLFASRDIPRGSIITFYPGDVLLIQDKEDQQEKDETDENDDWGTPARILWGDHTLDTRRTPDKIQPEYVLQTSIDEWSIAALPELGHPDGSYYLGHYANDGAQTPTCMAEVASYVLQSHERNNAMHCGRNDCHMATVATKDIYSGEEIMVTYGPEYWMHHEGFDDAKRTTSSNTGKGFG
jgi:hypothetical protein